MTEFICLVCSSNHCRCMTEMSPQALGRYNNDALVELFNQMVDPHNRWPDGREDNAAAWVKKELELRGVKVEYPLALTLGFYKQ